MKIGKPEEGYREPEIRTEVCVSKKTLMTFFQTLYQVPIRSREFRTFQKDFTGKYFGTGISHSL